VRTSLGAGILRFAGFAIAGIGREFWNGRGRAQTGLTGAEDAEGPAAGKSPATSDATAATSSHGGVAFAADRDRASSSFQTNQNSELTRAKATVVAGADC